MGVIQPVILSASTPTPSLSTIMAWQQYITNLEVSPHVASAMIVGHNGGLWAKGDGITHDAGEMAKAFAGFANPQGLYATGLHLEGTKYLFLRSPADGVLYIKKGQTGACLCKTQQAIIICKYSDGMNAGNCNMVAENMKEYLVGQGY